MTWFKLDDGFPEHRKVAAAGHLAGWLFVCGLAYCSRQLTDGAIPKPIVPRLTDIPKPSLAAARLVEVGLWTDEGTHFLVHGYCDFQRTAAQVEGEREAARRRQRSRRGHGDVTVMSRRDIGEVTRPEAEAEAEVPIQILRVTKEVVHNRLWTAA